VRKSRAATAATSSAVQHIVPAIALTDEQMVRQILDGNDDLFEELVKRHQRQIVNFIYRMVGDFDLALDMSQDVFIRVFRTIGQFRGQSALRTWMPQLPASSPWRIM